MAAILSGSVLTALPAAAANAVRTSAAPTAGRSPGATLSDGVLTGQVRGPDGAGLGRVCVVAASRMGTRAAVTTSGGRYVITGMRPGSYAIGFRDCGAAGRYMNQWYGGSILPDVATLIRVTANTPVTLKPVTMQPVGGMRARDSAAARTAAARSGRSAASGPSIKGVVENAAGKGLSGVCVSAFTSTATSATGEGTLTGRGGHYSFNVGRGRWEIGFANECGGKYAPQWWKHVGSEAKATLLNVRRGSHFSGIDAKLVIGGIITGTVRAGQSSGPGLGGVCVVANGRGRAAGIEQIAKTRKDGSYKITGLGTGRYQMQFDSHCGAGGRYVGRTLKGLVGVSDGKTTRGINTFLVRAAEISGTVTAAQGGAPLAGICVFSLPIVTGQGVVPIGEFGIQSGPQGGYTITGLTPGEYTVNFSGGCGSTGSYAPQDYNNKAVPAAADTVTLAAGQHATGINAAMQPGGTITGKVTDHASAPLGGICVFATSEPDAGGLGTGLDGLLIGSPGAFFSDVVGTGPKGGYRIANLVPGSYAVSFASGCGARLGPTVYAAQWFDPQGGNLPDWLAVRAGVVTSGISASLRRGGSIAGIVRTPAGNPLRGICATAFPLSGQPTEALLVAGGAGSARDGSYQIRGLAAGRYSVVFGPCAGQPYALSWFKGATSSASAKPVSVTDGHVTGGINARMSGGRSVAGTVRSGASGSPLKSVCVVAVDSGGLAVNFTVTGSKGRYMFGHLASGRYTVEFFPCGSAGSTLANVTKSVLVGGSPVTGASVTLPQAGAVTGTVGGSSPAAPVAGVCVEATPKTGRGPPGLAVTDGQGQYRMTGLAAGTYTVLFAPDCPASLGGFQPQWFDGQQREAQATPVGVGPAGTHAGVGATLAADGGITGTVQVSDSPASGVCVIAYPASGTRRPAVAETSADGSYGISDLPPGGYDVEFTAGCGASSYMTQWYNGAASKGAATPVVVTSGSVTQAIDAH